MKLSELDDPDTISEVVGDREPPSNMISSPPGRLQHMWSSLPLLSVREGRGETSVPVIFSQEWSVAGWLPPQTRPEQEVWKSLSSCRSWTGQELPLDGLYSSTFFRELSGYPPDIMKPGIINNCQHEAWQGYTIIGEFYKLRCSICCYLPGTGQD